MSEARLDTSRHRLSLTDSELFYRLGWFTRFRWVMGVSGLLVLLFGWYVMGVRFRPHGEAASVSPAVTVLLIVFLYNAAFAFLVHILQSRGRITRRLIVNTALGQLVCDMVALTVFAHFTGGVENFFLILILLPLVIVTELLPPALTYVTAGGAVILINALAWGEQQGLIRHVHAEFPGGGVRFYDDPLYVLVFTASLTVTIFAMVFVAASISQRLRWRERQLEEARDALSASDEAKSFFMRRAGHELRAPLAAIYSILEAVAETCEGLKERHCRLIHRAQERTRALMQMVDDLRQYSRIRVLEPVLRVERIDLEKVVHSTVELFSEQADAAGVSLTFKTEPASLAGDEELVRELVTNLISNAIQYTPAGGKVDVMLTAYRDEVLLTVSDTGIGIGDEAASKLFDEFYRGAEARNVLTAGTGLGLSITKRIVEMHAGQIDFTSQLGRGSTFTVRLPRRMPDKDKR